MSEQAFEYQHLLEAATLGDVFSLADAQLEIDLRSVIHPESGDHLIHSAAAFGQIEVIRYLMSLEPAFDANATNSNGSTPLHLSCGSDSADINDLEAVVEYLISIPGCQVDDLDQAGFSPFFLSTLHDHLSLARLLFETGHVDVNRTNRDGFTPLTMASLAGKIETVRFLSNTKLVDPNIESPNGSALHLAVRKRNLDMVKCLVDVFGRSLVVASATLQLATSKNLVDIVKCLESVNPPAPVAPKIRPNPFSSASSSAAEPVQSSPASTAAAVTLNVMNSLSRGNFTADRTQEFLDYYKAQTSAPITNVPFLASTSGPTFFQNKERSASEFLKTAYSINSEINSLFLFIKSNQNAYLGFTGKASEESHAHHSHFEGTIATRGEQLSEAIKSLSSLIPSKALLEKKIQDLYSEFEDLIDLAKTRTDLVPFVDDEGKTIQISRAELLERDRDSKIQQHLTELDNQDLPKIFSTIEEILNLKTKQVIDHWREIQLARKEFLTNQLHQGDPKAIEADLSRLEAERKSQKSGLRQRGVVEDSNKSSQQSSAPSLTPLELATIHADNVAFFNERNKQLEDILKLEKGMNQINQLVALFDTKVTEQAETLADIVEHISTATASVTKGKDHLVKESEQSRFSARRILLILVLLPSFVLLLLHWIWN